MLIEEKDIEIVDEEFIIEAVAQLIEFDDVESFISTYKESTDKEKMYLILCIFDTVKNISNIKNVLYETLTEDIKYLKQNWFRPDAKNKIVADKFNPVALNIAGSYIKKYKSQKV